MNEKQKKRNKIVGISIGILVVLLVVISSTYAYWQITKSQEGSNDIIAACLNIDMQSVDGTFEMNPAWPISDNEGMKLEGYTFKVTNNCPEDVNYIIGMDSLVKTGVEYLNYDSVKLSVDNNDPVIYGSQETIEHIEENDPYQIRDSKKLYTAVVKGKVGDTPGSNTHNVKVWIKAESDLEDREKVFSGRMFITGGQKIENDKPLAKLLATGDISRTEECKSDGYSSYNCIPVTGNNVDYYFYSDGTLNITGTGATKQYLYPKPNVDSGLVPLLSDIAVKYAQTEKIALTEEELNLLQNGDFFIFLSVILNHDDSFVEFVSQGECSTIEEWLVSFEDMFDADTIKVLNNIATKYVNFPKFTDIIIGDGITSIGNHNFAYILFENLNMADTVLELKEGAFMFGGFTNSYKFSNNLAIIEKNVLDITMYDGSLKIPDSVSSLEAFTSTSNFSEIIFPKNINVTTIPSETFNEMYNLTSIVIPENITNMKSSFEYIEDKSKVSLKLYGPVRTVEGLNENEFKEVIWNYQGE